MVASSTAVPSLSVTSAVPSSPPADFPAQSGRDPARSNTPRSALSDIGSHHWTLEFAGPSEGIAHSPGALSIPVRAVAAPDHEITIEVVDRESGAPLEGVNLIMHPYRATTDRNGMARMKVAADHYELHASGLQRLPYRDHLDATKPVELRILMAVEQQSSHWTIPVKPQELSIAQVLK